MGRKRTGPPCSVDRRRTAHAPDSVRDDDRRRRQTTTTDADRRQRAKQYWPIRHASNKQTHWL